MRLVHGIGSRADLPLPFLFAVVGAVVVLVLSFVLLGMLWRTPRLDGVRAGRALPAPVASVLDSRALRVAVALVGAVFALWTLTALLLGPADARNATPFVVYVLLWVGLVPLSLVFGPGTWRRLNPLRSLHLAVCRAARLHPDEGLRALPAWGWWPAAAALTAFLWLELVAPDNTEVGTLGTAIALYAGVQMLAGFLYGSTWFARGDAFEAWSSMFGRLSPLGRRDDGTLVLRSPLAGLDQVRPERGLVAVVVVMLGGTAYDSVREHPRYVSVVQTADAPRVLLDTLGLLAVLGLVALLFVAATSAAGRLSGGSAAGMPTAFAHSIVPIALGYVVAHYYSLLVLEGQNAFIRLANPFGDGGFLAGRAPDATLIAPTTVATVQVVAIVVGHVLGVVLAHDRAVRLFPHRRALAGQLPLLALMIAYTCAGLLLLFAA
ncbi:MAG TPA: hypothetical protein VFD41_07125 [Actinomycetales bacterium]|nr:hypothetical protein [Actinomycetales bacterium]